MRAMAMLAVALAAAGIDRVVTQERSRSFGLLSGRDRLEAMRRLWNEGSAFIPGDVLIKFRADATNTQRSRAMTVVRGGVDGQRSEWIGDVLWAAVPGETSISVAAERLRAQPEVLWVDAPATLRGRGHEVARMSVGR